MRIEANFEGGGTVIFSAHISLVTAVVAILGRTHIAVFTEAGHLSCEFISLVPPPLLGCFIVRIHVTMGIVYVLRIHDWCCEAHDSIASIQKLRFDMGGPGQGYITRRRDSCLNKVGITVGL